MWNLCPSVLWIRQQDVCGTCVPVYCDWIRQQDVCGTCVPVYCDWIRQQDVCGTCVPVYCDWIRQQDVCGTCVPVYCDLIRQQDVCGTCVPVYCGLDQTAGCMWNLCPSVLWIRLQDVCGTCVPVWQHTALFRRTRPCLLLKCAATEDRNIWCFLLYVSALFVCFHSSAYLSPIVLDM